MFVFTVYLFDSGFNAIGQNASSYSSCYRSAEGTVYFWKEMKTQK